MQITMDDAVDGGTTRGGSVKRKWVDERIASLERKFMTPPPHN